MSAVDYRCRGERCPVKANCKRAALGDKSALPYAAFDLRREGDETCAQYLPISKISFAVKKGGRK